MSILRFILVLASQIAILFSKVNGQPNNCTIESGIFNQGKATINYQYNTGFCKEWIIGPVSKQTRITILFLQIEIDCNSGDKLYLYNEERTFILYDYCSQDKNFATGRNVVVSQAKYLLAKLISYTSKLLTVTFDMFLFDSPTFSNAISQQQQQQQQQPFPSYTTQQTQAVTNSVYKTVNPSCSQIPIELTDTIGYVRSPLLGKDYSSNIHCSWVLKAPINHRVYLLFDYINLPNEEFTNNNNECPMNFVTIASQLKPYDNVKLCGYRRRVKFITTYNNVLINLDVGMIKEISAGFSLTYKVIMTPSDLVQTTTKIPEEPFFNTNLPPNYNCGIPFYKPLEVGARIIGGVESVAHSWPWQVMITDGMIMCGAALISNEWVLTAAHCTENINNGPIKAHIGMHNRLKMETNRVTRFINQVVVHPNYMGRLTQWDFDIALLRLEEPVTYTIEIQPICLPPQGVNFAKVGSKGTVIGWGDTMNTGPVHILRQASITVIKNHECGASSDNMLCAGEKTPTLRDSCQGDSGGPFFMKVNTNYYLVGIVSWGYDCNGAGVYTKVSNFVNWVNSIIAATSA